MKIVIRPLTIGLVILLLPAAFWLTLLCLIFFSTESKDLIIGLVTFLPCSYILYLFSFIAFWPRITITDTTLEIRHWYHTTPYNPSAHNTEQLRLPKTRTTTLDIADLTLFGAFHAREIKEKMHEAGISRGRRSSASNPMMSGMIGNLRGMILFVASNDIYVVVDGKPYSRRQVFRIFEALEARSAVKATGLFRPS
jgi:hypothetical protein